MTAGGPGNGSGGVGGGGERPLSPPLRALLAVPLLGKLVGANALVVLAAVAIGARAPGEHDRVTLAVVLAGALANLLLVYLALRPLAQLEATAARVSRGDLAARVPPSALADRDMARVGATLNLLLDTLAEERRRVRRLAAQVIGAGDAERGRIARELHDSTAQTLAALALQVRAAAVDAPASLADRLELVRELAGEAVEEVRTLSSTIHPRVLDDLGLPSALRWLARHTGEQHGVKVTAEVCGDAERFAPAVASALYRVAQEALTNAVRHARPSGVRLSLLAAPGGARLEVQDDGPGFDVAAARARRPGMGLFTMAERMALVDGTLSVERVPGGTRVTAAVPFPALANGDGR